jgi:uncharacterized protein (TIRG00374 family)
MAYKYSLWFLSLSVLIVLGVWNNLDTVALSKLSHDWSYDVGGRLLGLGSLLGFVSLWALALWARCARYQCLAGIAGVQMYGRDAFESVTLGRFFTLITPSALLGGQPISYFRLATRYPARVAVGVVTVATWLDIAFFIVTTPIVVWRVIYVLQFEHRYATMGALTFLVYALILVAFWLALSRWADKVIRLAARFWSTLIPFWQEATLQRTFTHAAQHLRTFVDALMIGKRQAWLALVQTAVSVLCPYIGIAWLLWAMGCDLGLLESIGNQLAINFMALVFSPGAGSGTSEFMFIRMFDRWEGQPGLIHLAIFMTASYWSYIVVGLMVWITWRPDGTLLTLEVEPALTSASPENLSVHVFDSDRPELQWTGIIDTAGEFSMLLPTRRRYQWIVTRPPDLRIEGRLSDSPLIKRVFIGAPAKHK